MPRVRDAVDGMMDEEQRAKQLAVTARELAPPVGRLAGRVQRKDGGFDLMATACSFSKGIDTVAALGRNAIPILQMVAPPIQTVLTYVKKFREVVDVANSTANDPAFARDLVASQVEAFLEKLAAHPLGFIQEAADKMRELSDVLFDRLGGYVEQLADFCAKQIQPVLYKVAEFLVSLADRIENKFQIEDALTNVTKWLDEDGLGGLPHPPPVCRDRAVRRAVPRGGQGEGVRDEVFDVAAILVQPGALVNKVVQPALDFVEKITDMDGIGAVFNETFGQLLEFGEDWVKDKLGDLQEYAEEFIGAMVEKAVSFADGLIDEIAAKAGQLGANILNELMPTWLPPLLSDILTYVDMIQGTLESIYDIVNGTTTDGILHFLELPMKMVKATCPADEVAELYGSADADEQIEAAGAADAGGAWAPAPHRRPLALAAPSLRGFRRRRRACSAQRGPAVEQGGWQSSEAVGGWPTCVRERGGAAAARVARE